MGWSLNIGSVAGTAVRIHITFLLFLVWIFGASYASGGIDAAWTSLVFIVLVFLCVLLHEFGHIFTARAFGVLTPDVVLLPIGGVARTAEQANAMIARGYVALALGFDWSLFQRGIAASLDGIKR